MQGRGITSDKDYWNKRYNKRHGISGDGSRGRLLAYKAHTYNLLAEQYGWSSVVDLGCGDGFIVPLIDHDKYIGYDISEKCIAYCNNHHYPSKKRKFVSGDIWDVWPAFKSKYDVAISFDVTFHITNEDDYYRYLHVLSTVGKQVLIFTVDENNDHMKELWGREIAPHVFYRTAVTHLIKEYGMRLVEMFPCPFDSRKEIKEGNTFSQMFLLDYV